MCSSGGSECRGAYLSGHSQPRHRQSQLMAPSVTAWAHRGISGAEGRPVVPLTWPRQPPLTRSGSPDPIRLPIAGLRQTIEGWEASRLSPFPLRRCLTGAFLPKLNSQGAPFQARRGRVGMWRGDIRSGMRVSAAFVWRCLSGSTIAPFPHPPGHRRRSPAPGSHRTWRADFPHRRSSAVASQHCKRLQLPVGEAQFRCQ